MEPMGPPPGRPRSRRTVEQMHEQMQLAVRAPPRPHPFDCDVCRDHTCNGGTCLRWRQRQREWVEAWGGHPPPEKGTWGNWWKGVKVQYAKLITAAEAADTKAAAAAAARNAAGKRHAHPEGTPNKGGQRVSQTRKGFL